MISFKEFLEEGKQVGILYHYTRLFKLSDIIRLNQLGYKGSPYCCFTRDKNFHIYHRYGVDTEQCRFVVDGDKLSNNYKIEPHNYFAKPSAADFGAHQDEQEERVEGVIKNFRKYVIKLQIFQKYLIVLFKNEGGISLGKYDFHNEKDLIKYFEEYCPVEII